MSDLSPKILKNPLLTKLRNYSEETQKAYDNLMISIPSAVKNVPDIWNGPVEWKDYLSPVKNQGSCGSCWAFASSSTLSDRFSILTNNTVKVDLSPVNMILCNLYDFEKSSSNDNILFQLNRVKKRACYGDTLSNAWSFLFILGVTSTKCTPYQYKKGLVTWNLQTFDYIEELPLCHEIGGLSGDMCVDYSTNTYRGIEEGTPARFYRCMSFYTVPGIKKHGGSELLIRKEIWKWGPVSAGMDVYNDFYTFDAKNSIYKWNGEGKKISGHAVEIVGWGIEGTTPFWWIKNTWGEKWGINGYFKMIRGENNCDIENNVVCGIPDFFLSYYNRDVFFDTYLKSSYKNTENFDVLQYELHVNEGASLQLGKIKYQVSGGIEPTLGYTRRVLNHYPSIRYKPLVDPSTLSNFTTFYAGKLNYNKSSLFEPLIENFMMTAKNGCKIPFVMTCVLIIILIIIVLIVFK